AGRPGAPRSRNRPHPGTARDRRARFHGAAVRGQRPQCLHRRPAHRARPARPGRAPDERRLRRHAGAARGDAGLLGDLYRRIQELDAAEPLLAEGIALAGETGDPVLVIHARLGKGLLDAAADRHLEALAEFDAVERALEGLGQVPGDRHGQLVMHRSRALTDVGKVPEAVAYAEAALARARSEPALPPEAMFFYLRALAA